MRAMPRKTSTLLACLSTQSKKTEVNRTMSDATIKEVMEFLNPSANQVALSGHLAGKHRAMDSKTMVREWKELSDKDKADIKAGIGNGTFTY
jgi:hypothetical protein